MKKLLHLGLTLAACALAPQASAQKEIPDKSPGKPVQPSDPARPETGDETARDRKHEVNPKPASETDFVKTAAKNGVAEVKVAQLAVEQAQDAKVKELAELLVRDHTAANAELKPIAESLGIKPGEEPNEKADQKYKELKARTGKEFDAAFLEHMSKCHDKGVAWYEAGKNVAKSEKVVAYIDKTLPVLKAHHAKIRELHTGTRPDASTDSRPETKR